MSRRRGGGDALVERLRNLEREARPLEPGPARRQQLLRAAGASAERYLAGLTDGPAYRRVDAPGHGLDARPIGTDPHPLRDVFRLLEGEVLAPGAHPQHPAHLAYIPGSGLPHAAVADFLAAVSNKYSGVSFSGPGLVRMENLVLRWTADLVGYPAEAAGATLSGGSLATLTALAAARDAHGLRGADLPRAVVYLSGQTHHCVEKALHLAGLAEVTRRQVPLDQGFRMRPEALAAQLAADRAAGLRPWLVVATAGSTDTGAVDPLEPIAEIAAHAGCWYHVDAAYGGFFLLTDAGRRLLTGIGRADSVVLDPHKGLFLPWGSGIVLLRDRARLLASNASSAHYMQDAIGAGEDLSPADLSPELSRPFRALRMWLPLMLLGTGPFAAALEEKLLLARYFHREIGSAGFETGPEPELSVVTFRWVPGGADLAEANRRNAWLVDQCRRDGRIFLSSTMLDGAFTIRMAALTARTHRAAMDQAVRVLVELRDRWPTGSR